MPDKLDAPGGRAPESNAQLIAGRLVYNTVDLDGSGLVQLLTLLLARAEQIRASNQRLGDLDARVEKREVANQQEFNAELLEGLYETTCLKWFLSCALKELSRRLESEVYGAQIRLHPIRQITYTDDGEVESFLLDFPDVEPGGAGI